MPLLSAHRCGAGDDTHLENTRDALLRAVTMDCDFVEFDVQRCGDGTLVLHHDDCLEIDGVLTRLDAISFERFAAHAERFVRYDEALLILRGHRRAHIDFKFTSPTELYLEPATSYEVLATQQAIEIMGADQIIVTTVEDPSVRAVRAWSKTRYPELLVGLSLGHTQVGRSRWNTIKARFTELFPGRRLTRCDANLVVAQKTLAQLSLARYSQRHGLPMLVWTVDDPQQQNRWLSDDRAWLVTTNYPVRAAELLELLQQD